LVSIQTAASNKWYLVRLAQLSLPSQKRLLKQSQIWTRKPFAFQASSTTLVEVKKPPEAIAAHEYEGTNSELRDPEIQNIHLAA